MSGKKIFFFASVSVLAITLIVSACNKKSDDEVTKVENTDYGKENARMEQIVNDAQTFTDQAQAAGNLNMKGNTVLGAACAVVTVDTLKKSVIVDFTNQNCLCKDGRYRRGRIVRTYTGKYRDSASFHFISFQNYYVDNHKVEGSVALTNKGKNAQKQLYYNVESNVTVTYPDNITQVTRTASQTRLVKKGDFSADVYDDEYNVNGYGTITMPNGGIYNMSIKAAILITPNCDWPLQGLLEITQVNGIARVFDYGNIGCDDKATLNVNGDIKQVILD